MGKNHKQVIKMQMVSKYMGKCSISLILKEANLNNIEMTFTYQLGKDFFKMSQTHTLTKLGETWTSFFSVDMQNVHVFRGQSDEKL